MAIGLFVDGAYLDICWRKISSGRLDFAQLRNLIERHCEDEITESYYFDSDPEHRRDSVYRVLQQIGFRVKLYPSTYEDVLDNRGSVMRDSTGNRVRRLRQKGVDVGLALQMLHSHDRCGWNRLVLVAGDADFTEPVQQLVELHNVRVTLVGVPENTSSQLRSYAESRIDLRVNAPDLQLAISSPLTAVELVRRVAG